MDARQQEALVQRLVANPQDQAAIAEAHASGQQDPEAYARLLERVGMATPAPAIAGHWLNEAANVWLTTFQNPERAATVLLSAVERDPTSEATATRLAELLTQNGDLASAAAALDRRANALAQTARREPDWLPRAAELFEELGRLWADPPLSDVVRAKQAYARAVDLDPTSQFGIYSLRELHKAAGEFAEALPYFGMEVALVTDAQRKLALYLDEAEVAKAAGKADRAISALGHAQRIDASDPTLKQQLGALILEKHRGGHGPSTEERQQGAELFVALAETYPGEHGFLYSLCALELNSSHDRAAQLAMYFGEQLGRLSEVAPLAAAYLRDSPGGVMAADAAQIAGDVPPPPAPTPSAAGASSRPPAQAGQVGNVVRPASAQRAFSEGPPPGVSVDDLVARAEELARKSRRNEAIATYRQVLDLDPLNSGALNYLQEMLPVKRKYAELKDVLLGAVDAPNALDEDRLGWLRELAAVCETQLRDLDTSVYAWQRVLELDREDDEATDQLKRLLEKARRWDDLANVLRQEADRTEDAEVRIAIERNLAKMHATKRKDPAAAGEAWARIAALSPGDEAALLEAVQLFEKAQRADLAADVIASNVRALDDDLVKRALYVKLADVRIARGQPLDAAEALAEGAESLGDLEMWHRAEQLFADGQVWEPAANAADRQAEAAADDDLKAALIARAAGYLIKDGDNAEAITRLEEAVSLAPTNDEYSSQLEDQLVAAARVDELVELFLTRSSKISDPAVRVVLRKRAAAVQRDRLGDAAAARVSFALVLQDAEDEETLQWLAEEARGREDADAAVEYLERLCKAVDATERKVQITLQQADLCATQLKDIARAAEKYETILDELDPKNEAALEALGDLEIARGNQERGAAILERYLEATNDRTTKLEVAARLASIYELNLSKPDDAIRLLTFVHETDPDDFDATQRLCELAEAAERWDLVAELMAELIAIEGEEDQISEMSRGLAQILHTHLDRAAEALEVLGGVGDHGDLLCREAFIELGDELNEKATVARRLVSWHLTEPPSQVRSDALHAAFDRFVEAQQDAEAIVIARDLILSGSAMAAIGEQFERLAVSEKDLESLAMAHELRARELSGAELATERVRQAEVLVDAGVDSAQAVGHGETALGEAVGEDVADLLARLAAVCPSPSSKVDVYERHIARCETLEERITALCRATEVAAEVGDLARARALFDVALTGGLEDDSLDQMIALSRAADERAGRTALRETLAVALAEGGQAARDGGRTRSKMLGLAAGMAHVELGDLDRAFQWLGDALILHVHDACLDDLEELAGKAGDYGRAEQVLARALDEVFDGPLVRRLLERRATLRQERMNDRDGAAEDLRRLHELSPADANVSDRLVAIYEEAGEHKGIVTLLEDQILRSRDKEHRANLSRRVARLWESELNDPREAADAWRRVLRLTKDDEEAKAGLARAKDSMLSARRDAAEQLATSPVPPLAAPPDAPSSERVPQSVASKDSSADVAERSGEVDEPGADTTDANGGDPAASDSAASDSVAWTGGADAAETLRGAVETTPLRSGEVDAGAAGGDAVVVPPPVPPSDSVAVEAALPAPRAQAVLADDGAQTRPLDGLNSDRPAEAIALAAADGFDDATEIISADAMSSGDPAVTQAAAMETTETEAVVAKSVVAESLAASDPDPDDGVDDAVEIDDVLIDGEVSSAPPPKPPARRSSVTPPRAAGGIPKPPPKKRALPPPPSRIAVTPAGKQED
jgi:tetratricopeptide (TPR) repeat protein